MRRATLVLACCCACSLGGKPPAYNYFVLTSTPSQARHVSPSADTHATIGVSLVTIPGYLDRDQIATRTNEFRVTYSHRDRWAEPLDLAFERTLKHDLAVALAPDGITLPTRAGAPTYDVQVDVLRFERLGADRVELWARWTLRSETELVHAADTRVRLAVTSPSSAAAAAALSETLLRLTEDIVKQVRIEVARQGTKPVQEARRDTTQSGE